MVNLNRKMILFGAGQIGKEALRYFGRERVYCFADNNQALAGGQVEGVPVISFEELRKIHEDYQIVLSVDIGTTFVLAAQLEDAGIHDYIKFLELAKKNTEKGPSERNRASVIHPENRSWNGKRVLMIAYQFPPLSGSGVFRSLKFAKYLPELGWKPTVVAADRPRPGWNYADESLVEEIPLDMDVIRVTDRVNSMSGVSLTDSEDRLLPFLRGVLQGGEEARSIFSELEKTKIGRAELLTFPCQCLSWAYDVVEYLEKNLDLRQFQAVYTTAEPRSTHLVGFYLKEKYGIPWVADYRDPWTENAYFLYHEEDNRQRLLYELETILLKAADRDIWVEENTSKSHMEHFGLPKEKVAAITNGYDEADFTGIEVSEARTDKFTIIFSGIAMLHADMAGIQASFIALRQLVDEGKLDMSSACFHFIGDAKQDIREMAKSYQLEDIVLQTGYCAHRKVLQANVDANLLLLIIGDEPRQKYVHAGKFFDYLRSGRPILALAPPDGVVAGILQETGHGRALLSTDLPGIKAFILREYQKWRRGEKRELLHSPLIEQFERKQLTGRLAEIFDEVRR